MGRRKDIDTIIMEMQAEASKWSDAFRRHVVHGGDPITEETICGRFRLFPQFVTTEANRRLYLISELAALNERRLVVMEKSRLGILGTTEMCETKLIPAADVLMRLAEKNLHAKETGGSLTKHPLMPFISFMMHRNVMIESLRTLSRNAQRWRDANNAAYGIKRSIASLTEEEDNSPADCRRLASEILVMSLALAGGQAKHEEGEFFNDVVDQLEIKNIADMDGPIDHSGCQLD